MVRLLVKYKCTRCDHTTEQYENLDVYHHNCPNAKRGELGIRMLPKDEK